MNMKILIKIKSMRMKFMKKKVKKKMNKTKLLIITKQNLFE